MFLETNPYDCALCGVSAGEGTLDSDKSFCCVGCQTVYTILSNRKELENYQNHPLFRQALQSGLISNPTLLEQIRKNQPKFLDEDLKRIHLEIQDLWCPSCAEIIRLLLLKEKGVKNCVVDYATDLAAVEFSPRYISQEKIMNLIRDIGYSPTPLLSAERKSVSFDLYLRFIIAAFFSLNIMMFSYPIYASYFNLDMNGYSYLFAWISLYASIPVLFYSAWPIYKRCFHSLSFGFAGMETLIVMGVTSAFAISFYDLLKGGKHVYFDSMSVIIAFVLLGKIIESRAKFSSKETLLRLSKGLPKRGRKRFKDGSERFELLKEISKGDFLVAMTGEKIVLDGLVIEGEGTCDESLMTGEVIPLRKKIGDKVLSGTIVCQGCIVYRVEAVEKETVLHQIIHIIKEDIGQKSLYSRTVDPFVKIFVPVVIAIAIGAATGLFLGGKPPQEAILRAISILLISCPCAIGIAAPLAEAKTLFCIATLGGMVRNRGCLKELGQEEVFIFDKTGTITDGCFTVIDGIELLSEEEKKILKAMTGNTTHPVSVAIHRNIEGSCCKPEKYEEVMGRGLKGFASNGWYFLGSRKYMEELAVQMSSVEETQDHWTEVYFAREQKLITRIILGDKIKEEAASVVATIKPARTVLLSGDTEKSVGVVAKACGFDAWKGGISPLEKKDYVDTIRREGKIVCMMGDGINDAPALASANIGISVATATDLSIQVSDILLTTDRLSVIPKIRLLAKRGQKILKQNLFWAFFYNIIGIGLAFIGHLNPLFSAIAMVLSSLIVICNAQRIRLPNQPD